MGLADAVDKLVESGLVVERIIGPINVAGHLCTSLQELKPVEIVGVLAKTSSKVEELLHAKNIWPYYDVIVHRIVCDEFVKSMGWLIIFNVIVGLVLFPVLALTADIDLRRWASWKEDHHDEHFGSRARAISRTATRSQSDDECPDNFESPGQPFLPVGSDHSHSELHSGTNPHQFPHTGLDQPFHEARRGYTETGMHPTEAHGWYAETRQTLASAHLEHPYQKTRGWCTEMHLGMASAKPSTAYGGADATLMRGDAVAKIYSGAASSGVDATAGTASGAST